MKERRAAAASDREEAGASTRDALMDAALEQLATKGVLAGLNLREVADEVGITPANIYHYFGSRQGLLRAALQRETARLAAPIATLSDASVIDRRLGMFDAISRTPDLMLTALLALDGDPAYEPLPFLDATRAHYRRQIEAERLPRDLDIDATQLASLAISIGFAIYGEAAARQLGVPVEALRIRVRRVFEGMLHGVLENAKPRRSRG